MNAEVPARTNSPASVITLSGDRDLLDCAAGTIIAHTDPPDLSQTVILLPNLSAATRLREHLLSHARQQDCPALLGPTITTLDGWLEQIPLTYPVHNAQANELMLLEALFEHRQFCGEAGPWVLADSLVTLFDELTRCHVTLPDELASFSQQLAQAYGLEHIPAPLSREAQLIHSLWRARRQQQQQQHVVDRETARIMRLSASLDTPPQSLHIYLIGHDQFTTAEARWLSSLLAQQRATLIVQSHHAGTSSPNSIDDASSETTLAHPSQALNTLLKQLTTADLSDTAAANTVATPYQAFIDAVFAPLPRLNDATAPASPPAELTDMASRARAFAQRYPASPVPQRLQVLTAHSAEQHAQALDTQIRLWLLQGKQRIGIVTADRRLTRRLRALQERAGITLLDHTGWALSTTSAATVIERLLQCAEEDYEQQFLLDLLKSPHLLPEWDQEQRLNACYVFERDIIQRENIARGLSRYRQHLAFRQRRVAEKTNPKTRLAYQHIEQLLQHIEQGVVLLQPLVARTASPAEFLAALDQALATLGITTCLAQDPAGSALLEALLTLRQTAADFELHMNWQEFRRWLDRHLEQSHYRPVTAQQQVQLHTLTEPPLQQFDALIIAAADAEHCPPPLAATPFFNNGVRTELGLANNSEHYALALARFCKLLQRAPQVILSWHDQEDKQLLNPSPWLTALNSFHQLAYGRTLHQDGILSLIPHAQVLCCDTAELPTPEAAPQPAAPPWLPDTLSASRYQQLLDCPYQYFAADYLALRAPEPVQLLLAKSDVGQRIHRILQAFHAPVEGLPGPFAETLNEANRQSAIDCLTAISRAVFAHDLEDNAQHRGWLTRWLALVPHYVDWQMRREQSWQVHRVEQQCLAQFADLPVSLSGQLDRIDIQRNPTDHEPGQLAIIDYKTGAAAHQSDVDSGESIQLPFYALLYADQGRHAIHHAQYVSLNQGKVTSGATIAEEQLTELCQQNLQRLRDIFTLLRQQHPLPAWGDEHSCRYCDFAGLCRKQAWQEPAA